MRSTIAKTLLAPIRQQGARALSTCEVALVGCGVPKRGMGWYHAVQMIDGRVPSAKLTDVVEPWFLGAGKDSEAGQEFGEWAKTVPDCGFHTSVQGMAKPAGKKLALISGRTADNPRLLREVIDQGCTHVFLEKPGAPSVSELESMAEYAASKGVSVFMGYNKNVTKYVTDALAFAAKTPGATTTFCANNAYKPEELDECFERNSEGMLKNMAVHELALLVTFYGVKLETIKSVTADKEFSVCEKRGAFTDFSRVGFTIETTEGKTLTVRSDRCGGSFNEAIVSVNGEEKFRSMTPDAELEKSVAAMEQASPGLMPYFYLQDEDYITLKERCCKHIVDGAPGMPEGIATIEIAIDTLKVAEYLTPEIQKQLGF